jgi:hypothetical protein
MTVLLLQASAIWVLLILVGLVVFAASFVARNPRLYWLLIFLATIPLNINKMLGLEPDDLRRLRESYGLFVNEIEIPVLALSDLPLLALLALQVADVLARRQRIVFPRGIFIALAFIAWCACTVVVARVPLLSMSWIFYQVKFLAIFLLMVNTPLTPRELRQVLAVLTVGLALQGGLGVLSYWRQMGGDFYGTLLGEQPAWRTVREAPAQLAAYLYVYEGYGQLRGSGTVGVSNELAKFIVPLLPLAVVGAFVATSLRSRISYIASFALGLAGLICTFSRGGLLAAVVAMAALGLMLTSRGVVSRRMFRVTVSACFLGALLAAPLLVAYMASRPGYLRMRGEHLLYGLQALLDRPVLGVGINNFNTAFSSQDYGGVFSDMAVHNHYLRVAVETGILGLLLYLAFFLWTARLAYRGTRSEDPFLAPVSAALLAGFIGIFFYWFDDLFYSVVIQTQFWILFTLAAVVYQLSTGRVQGAPSSAIEQRR